MSSKSNSGDCSRRQPKFEKDVKDMLYGFGDSWPPDPETVKLVDALAQQYLEDISFKALEVAQLRGGKLDKDCFMYVVRKETYKFNRIKQLLEVNEELKKAKTLAEVNDEETLKKARFNIDESKS